MKTIFSTKSAQSEDNRSAARAYIVDIIESDDARDQRAFLNHLCRFFRNAHPKSASSRDIKKVFSLLEVQNSSVMTELNSITSINSTFKLLKAAIRRVVYADVLEEKSQNILYFYNFPTFTKGFDSERLKTTSLLNHKNKNNGYLDQPDNFNRKTYIELVQCIMDYKVSQQNTPGITK